MVRSTDKKARRRIERALGSSQGSQRSDVPNPPAGKSRRAKMGLLVAALTLISIVLAFKVWNGSTGQHDPAEEAFQITRLSMPLAAPDFRLETREGKPLSLADVKGQVLFVNFWATWCPPCREEMPSMLVLGRELEHRYPGRFKMVAVSVDEGWDPIQQFFGGRPPDGILVGLDRDQIATRAYYCAARGGCPDSYKFPESYVIDRDGRLVAYVVGPRDWSDPAARRFLQRLIGS